MSERTTCPLCGNPDATKIDGGSVPGITAIIGCKCMEGREALILPDDFTKTSTTTSQLEGVGENDNT